MCWSYEVSLMTGATATIMSVYLLTYGKGNDIPIALVSIVIAFMQFGEALMWKGVTEKDERKSTLGAHVGILSLLLQPLVLGLSALWISGFPTSILILFVGLWNIMSFSVARSLLSQSWNPQPGCGGHLRWPFLQPLLDSIFSWIYWPVMFGAWLLFRPFSEGLHYSLMALGTFGITWWLFPGEWGTLWCFIANLLPLGRILL